MTTRRNFLASALAFATSLAAGRLTARPAKSPPEPAPATTIVSTGFARYDTAHFDWHGVAEQFPSKYQLFDPGKLAHPEGGGSLGWELASYLLTLQKNPAIHGSEPAVTQELVAFRVERSKSDPARIVSKTVEVVYTPHGPNRESAIAREIDWVAELPKALALAKVMRQREEQYDVGPWQSGAELQSGGRTVIFDRDGNEIWSGRTADVPAGLAHS